MSKTSRIRHEVLAWYFDCHRDLSQIKAVDNVGFLYKNKCYQVLTGEECKKELGFNPFIPKECDKNNLVKIEACVKNKYFRTFFIKEVQNINN
jgi:hypothetical protein